VGETTFGKGCVQGLLPITAPAVRGSPGGLRITVSRFYSPTGAPYSGRGVSPDLPVQRDILQDSLAPIDPQLEEALEEAQRLIDLGRPN
jgi:C-terminal processing protease CtpA/Prc